MEQKERRARRNSSYLRQSWDISSLHERILAVAQRSQTNVETKRESKAIPAPTEQIFSSSTGQSFLCSVSASPFVRRG